MFVSGKDLIVHISCSFKSLMEFNKWIWIHSKSFMSTCRLTVKDLSFEFQIHHLDKCFSCSKIKSSYMYNGDNNT